MRDGIESDLGGGGILSLQAQKKERGGVQLWAQCKKAYNVGQKGGRTLPPGSAHDMAFELLVLLNGSTIIPYYDRPAEHKWPICSGR